MQKKVAGFLFVRFWHALAPLFSFFSFEKTFSGWRKVICRTGMKQTGPDDER